MRILTPAAALALCAVSLAACATGPSEKNWISNAGAQSFATSVAACNEISYNSEANFKVCMAGRGWTRVKG